MEDKDCKDLNEDLNFDDILPPEDPMTPEELAQIKLPLSYETFQYMCWCGYTINNYDSLPEPLRSQFEKRKDEHLKKIGMSHWD